MQQKKQGVDNRQIEPGCLYPCLYAIVDGFVKNFPTRRWISVHRYKRSVRVADLIRQEVADIIQNRLKDPRVGFVTVTDVTISDDLKHGSIYISVLNKEACDETLKALNASAGFIRSELGKRVRLRSTPKLAFRLDEVVEQGAKIDRLLNQIKKEE